MVQGGLKAFGPPQIKEPKGKYSGSM